MMLVHNIKLFVHDVMNKKAHSIMMFETHNKKTESHHIIRKAHNILINAHVIMLTAHHIMMNT